MENKYSINAIKAIIGLGNPGQSYYKNRHSIGFRVLDELAKRHGTSWAKKDTLETTVIPIGPHVILIKPQTFMNSSGQVLHTLLKKGIKPEQILVIHDELEKPFGSIMMRLGGSHRGHNGLKSIMGIIGDQFWRLRFGIGRPDDKNEVADYVLSNFPPDQESLILGHIDQAINLLETT
jgi:PTH1 family peptidyl-tRNA hydrolase